MDWMGRKRRERDQAEREDLVRNIDRANVAITALSARLNCAESFIMALLETNDPSRKAAALDAARVFVVQLGDLKPPHYVMPEYEQAFRDELSRALQTFIEIASHP